MCPSITSASNERGGGAVDDGLDEEKNEEERKELDELGAPGVPLRVSSKLGNHFCAYH